MRALGVVKWEIFGQTNHQFAHRGITLQIHVFILDVAPQPLDKDVVENASPAIHADDDIGLTQEEFAAKFSVSLGTLRHWERGDRKPHGPALVLLRVIDKEGRAVMRALAA